MTGPLIDGLRRPSDAAELRRLRLAIEASGEIIFTTDPSGTFTYVNPEFERVYGYGFAEVVGRTTPRILKGGTTVREQYVSFWTELTEKRIIRRQFINRTKDGALLNIECSANPIVGDSGEVVGFLAVQRDITEQKQIAAALEESERRCRTMANAAHDSIFIVNRATVIEYANEMAAARFGMSSADVVGKSLDEVFAPKTAADLWRELSKVFTTGRRQLVENVFESPNGELWLETWFVPLDGEGSETRAVMGVGRDVTERKRLERQFLQAQKMEAVGRLAGGIAHDFNNLLTAILGYSELVIDRVHDAPDVLADLEEIKKAGERASRLTRQLLAFSRKQPMIRQALDVNSLVADISTMLRRVMGEDIALNTNAEPDLWKVHADPGQIEQVLLNLAVNARDAMPKGGRLTITTANTDLDHAFVDAHPGALPGPHVSLAVQDTGSGMTADVLAHVFEPFFTTKPSGQGTGLGLSTGYGIVNQHGGYITIDSRPGIGTAVTILLPRKDGVSEATAIARTSPLPLLGSETILLVEDEPGLRRLMRRTLEGRKYLVLEAHDVSDALALASAHEGPIDLLLSDVIMPGMNGPDLAQRIIARRPEVKILYVSGFPSSLLAEEGWHARRVAFLAKPFTPQALAKKVRECLDS
jgi:PAS domain S-box-containing protein